MAKSDNLNSRLLSLKEETDQLKENQLQLKKLYALEDKITNTQFKKIESLETQNKELEKSKNKYEVLLKLQKDKAKILKAELNDYDAIDANLISIGNTIGKNTKAYQFQKEKLDKTKGVLESIGIVISKNSKISNKDKGQMVKVLKAYKQNQSSILEASKLKIKGKITEQEYLKIIEESRKAYSDVRSEIELSVDASELLAQNITDMDNEINSFANSAKKSASVLKGFENSINTIAGSGVDGVKELGDVLKIATNGGKGLSLALGALAGVAAGMAYNFGLIGNKLATIAGYDSKIAGLTGEIDAINQKVNMGVNGFGERNFVMEQAMLDFNSSVQQMGAAFNAASKTALFGNKLGSVGYGAAQLQLAGVSAEEISTSLSAASNVMGKRLSSQLAADMAVMSKRTGQSAENLASVTEYFMRTDKVGAKSAINMQEGLRAMADSAKVDLGGVMEEVAEASKEALGYQIKSGPALAKQVIYAKSLGVSFNDIAKAGKSMVLNYKDSIKNEMQLSAMLGRNVNLSEARSLFAQGKNDEALKSIQAQGLDPAKMNMFQQEALQQALGGLDLNSIQKVAQNQARSGGSLTEGNVGTGNKEFLSRVKERETSLAGANAMISAATELQRIGLNAASEQQKQQAIIDDVGGIAKLINERDQQGFLKNAETMLTTALISTVATVVTTFLMNKGGGLLSKFTGKGIEKPLSKTAEKPLLKTAEKPLSKTAEKQLTKQAEKQLAKQGGRTAAKALGKSLLKKIPFLGLGMGLLFAGQKALAGDFTGAGLEVASGGASMIPGFGTAASFGIDAAIAARDMGAFDSKNPTATVKKPGTVSAKSASVVGKSSLVLSDVQYQTRLQMKMVELLGTNAILLQSILEETDKDKSIKLNGVKLNTQLMFNARKQMAVSRKEAIGTNASM